jgi:hypothetical protein
MKHYEFGNWLIQPIEEWSQFFERCNWYTFRFAHLEVEDNHHMGEAEVTIVILGLGVRVSYEYTKTELKKQIGEQIDEILRDDGNASLDAVDSLLEHQDRRK